MAISGLKMFTEDNELFRGLLDMVPARILMDDDTKRKIRDEEADGEGGRHKVKLDPLQRKTISQLQEDLDQREGHKTLTKKQRRKQKTTSAATELSLTRDLETLRSRLQDRISELSGKKRSLSENELQEKSKLMKRNKKLKLKLRRSQKQNRNKGRSGSGNSADESPSVSDTYMVSDKPVYNTEGKLVFSKFDFGASGDSDKPKTDLKGKNYKRLLEKLEKRKKKANEVREKSQEAGLRLEEKTAWKTALLKAEGQTVKDNEHLLRKAVKKKDRDSHKKKKSWEARVNHVEQGKKKRQEKRKQNIDSRKKQKKDSKKKKLMKKGRIIQGF